MLLSGGCGVEVPGFWLNAWVGVGLADSALSPVIGIPPLLSSKLSLPESDIGSPVPADPGEGVPATGTKRTVGVSVVCSAEEDAKEGAAVSSPRMRLFSARTSPI